MPGGDEIRTEAGKGEGSRSPSWATFLARHTRGVFRTPGDEIAAPGHPYPDTTRVTSVERKADQTLRISIDETMTLRAADGVPVDGVEHTV